VSTRTHDGLPVRMLTIVDEYTRECLAIDVARAAACRRRPGPSGGVIRLAWSTELYTLGQWTGVYGQCSAEVA
jgi:hypothetical protein